MQFTELLAQVVSSLLANKLRSALTMFGIAWGILSILLLMAMGSGLEKGQAEVAETLGKDILIVFGGVTSQQAGGQKAGRRVWLDRNDVELIRRNCPNVEHVTPELKQQLPVRSAYNSGRFSTHGALPVFRDIRTQILAEGRFHNDADEAESHRVAVVGWDVRAQLFAGRHPLGEQILIGGIPYTVIGRLARKDQDSDYDGRDNTKIFVPFSAMQRDFPNRPPRRASNIDNLVITPRHVDVHDRAEAEIRGVLARKYGFHPQDKEAIFIWDTVKSSRMFQRMTQSMQAFLGAVGVVTLLLGGIGVMNIMLVSVQERTREIGVRMAVGATRRAILGQFFAEALLLTALSGAIGVAVGLALCAAVTAAIPPGTQYFAGLVVRPATIAGAVLALGVVAVCSGIYPARRASLMQPVEALRYEHS